MDETLFYFVDDNRQRQGPCSPAQLAELITSDTLVWTEGMAEWTPACEVPALAAMFERTQIIDPVPPTFVPEEPYYAPEPEPQKKSNVGLIIALVAAVVVALAAVGYIIYSNNTTKISDTSYGQNTEMVDVAGTPAASEASAAAPAPEEPAPAPAPASPYGQHSLSGSISKYPITMNIHIGSDGSVYGSYRYTKGGYVMDINGDFDGSNMVLNESEPGKEEYTGDFDGHWNGRTYSGTFTRYRDGKQMSFTISE